MERHSAPNQVQENFDRGLSLALAPNWCNYTSILNGMPQDIFDSPSDVTNSGLFDDDLPSSGSWPTINVEDLDGLEPSHCVKSELQECHTESTDSMATSQFEELSSGNADSTNCGSIPSKDNWPGEYNFNIEFEHQPQKLPKSTSWTYSAELDKLFVSLGVSCVISFVVEHTVPKGCVIRTLPIFESDEHINKVVKRCTMHSHPDHSSNKDHPAPGHLVRCSNSLAEYVTSDTSHRYSVTVPLESPEAGSTNTKYSFKFMCLGSCVGGINRRALLLLFTLEKCGEVLGRRTLRLRVCACPGRDRRAEEQGRCQLNTATRPNPVTQQAAAAAVTYDEIKSIVLAYNRRGSRDENEIFLIPVQGRAMCERLLRIKAGLELPPEIILGHYQQEEPPVRVSTEADLPLSEASTSASKKKPLQPKAKKRKTLS